MRILMKIMRNLVLLFGSMIISYFLAGYFYHSLYGFVYGDSDGGFFAIYVEAAKVLIILVLSFIFFTPLLFTSFGDSKKYWWIAISLIPALFFEIYFGLGYIYIPIIAGLIGWGIGFTISRVVSKKRLINT